MLKKIFGGIFAFLVVLVVIVACFGEEESGKVASSEKELSAKKDKINTYESTNQQSSDKANSIRALIEEYKSISVLDTDSSALEPNDDSRGYDTNVEQRAKDEEKRIRELCKVGDKNACRKIELWDEIHRKVKEGGDAEFYLELYNGLDWVWVLKKACELNHIPTCYKLAGEMEDMAARQAEYKRLCDEFDYVEACSTFSLNAHNDEQELQYALKACNLGRNIACNSLGYKYERGSGGVAINFATAKSFYEKACELGYNKGCENAERITKERGL